MRFTIAAGARPNEYVFKDAQRGIYDWGRVYEWRGALPCGKTNRVAVDPQEDKLDGQCVGDVVRLDDGRLERSPARLFIESNRETSMVLAKIEYPRPGGDAEFIAAFVCQPQ